MSPVPTTAALVGSMATPGGVVRVGQGGISVQPTVASTGDDTNAFGSAF